MFDATNPYQTIGRLVLALDDPAVLVEAIKNVAARERAVDPKAEILLLIDILERNLLKLHIVKNLLSDTEESINVFKFLEKGKN